MMPWTFAHPAAVLPLRRYCPRWLNFPALMIGSLTPDFGYYVNWLDLSRLAHRFPEGLAVCVLPGLLLLGAFYALRRPLCHMLPQPHRGVLMLLVDAHRKFSLRTFLSMLVSLALGAATHMAWDGLTHRGGWAVMQLLALQEPLLRLWGAGVPAYQVLQHLSTAFGVAALAWVYLRWLRREQPLSPRRVWANAVDDRWRYRLFGAITMAAIAWGLFSATQAALRRPGKFLLDVFVFRAAVDFVTVFVLLFFSCAMGYRWQQRRKQMIL